jgi:hypothetical protein
MASTCSNLNVKSISQRREQHAYVHDKPCLLPLRSFIEWLFRVEWVEEQRDSKVRYRSHGITLTQYDDRHYNKSSVEKAIDLWAHYASTEQ